MMKEFIDTSKRLVKSVTDRLVDELDAGFTTIKQVANGLPIFVSIEKSDKFKVQYDEMHHLSQAPP